MNNVTNSGAPDSHENQVKIAKEALKQVAKVEEKIVKVECGLDNPGKFGKHNPNFNKHNIMKSR